MELTLKDSETGRELKVEHSVQNSVQHSVIGYATLPMHSSVVIVKAGAIMELWDVINCSLTSFLGLTEEPTCVTRLSDRFVLAGSQSGSIFVVEVREETSPMPSHLDMRL